MLVKKLAPPLVTLLSAEPEIQYVALRNINLVVQKRFLTVCDTANVLLLVRLLWYYYGGSVAEWLRRWTRNSEVASSIPGRGAVE